MFKAELNSQYLDIREINTTLGNTSLSPVIVSNAKILAGIDKRSELYAGVSNLEDVHYELRSGYPMPGRTYYCGVNYKF